MNNNKNIKVYVRFKPILNFSNNNNWIEIINDKEMLFIDKQNVNNVKTISYNFEHIFKENNEQKFIYDKIIENKIDDFFNGFNCCIIAYGAHKSGKTFTINGKLENPGIIPRFINDIFEKYYSQIDNYEIKVSFMEIYNEVLRDLLSQDNKNLEIREENNKGISIKGLTEIVIDEKKDAQTIIKIGNKNKTRTYNNSNLSSRSHSLLIFNLEKKDPINNEIKTSKFYFVDLAGSEKINNSQAKNIYNSKISKSLWSWNNCINALSENSYFVPFRDSKLTRILKDTLGGNFQTNIICNIINSEKYFEETQNSLKYCNLAQNIRNSGTQNLVLFKDNKKSWIDIKNIIKNLKIENNKLKNKLEFKQKLIRSNTIEKKEVKAIDITIMCKRIKNHFEEEKTLYNNINNLKKDLNTNLKWITYEKNIKNLKELKNKKRNWILDEILNSNLNNYEMNYLNNLFKKEKINLVF